MALRLFILITITHLPTKYLHLVHGLGTATTDNYVNINQSKS